MLCVVHIENASPQATISKSRQKAAGIDHRGHQFSCILRFFLVSSSSVFFCGLTAFIPGKRNIERSDIRSPLTLPCLSHCEMTLCAGFPTQHSMQREAEHAGQTDSTRHSLHGSVRALQQPAPHRSSPFMLEAFKIHLQAAGWKRSNSDLTVKRGGILVPT